MSGKDIYRQSAASERRGSEGRHSVILGTRAGNEERDLADPNTIIKTMARDILTARREGIAGLVDLTEYGWTPAQVIRHAASAHARANAPAFQLHHLGDVA